MNFASSILLLTLISLSSSQDIKTCHKFLNRSFVPPEKQRNDTTVLWTFPGSGSGWVRLLIEHATGHYTGSVYYDESLVTEMPGEGECSPRVVLIKAHPTTHKRMTGFRNGKLARMGPTCKTIHDFDKAIIVIRNPYDAIWSDHNRKITRNHIGKIKKNKFRYKLWEKNALRLAFAYENMWKESYDPFIEKVGPDKYVIVKYEDLMSSATQMESLAKIMKVLKYEYTMERLKCAFYLSNHPKVKRSEVSQDTATKEEAYNRPLVCKMWKNLAYPSKRGQYTRYKVDEYTC